MLRRTQGPERRSYLRGYTIIVTVANSRPEDHRFAGIHARYRLPRYGPTLVRERLSACRLRQLAGRLAPGLLLLRHIRRRRALRARAHPWHAARLRAVQLAVKNFSMHRE